LGIHGRAYISTKKAYISTKQPNKYTKEPNNTQAGPTYTQKRPIYPRKGTYPTYRKIDAYAYIQIDAYAYIHMYKNQTTCKISSRVCSNDARANVRCVYAAVAVSCKILA